MVGTKTTTPASFNLNKVNHGRTRHGDLNAYPLQQRLGHSFEGTGGLDGHHSWFYWCLARF